MNILVIGGGGREYTLGWKLAQSPKCTKLYAVPGNPGMKKFAVCLEGIDVEDNAALVKAAQQYAVDLVVVGPEVPLTNGVVDAMQAAGIRAFGPSKAAAELEGSKSFSKSMMKKYGIPTAKYEVFTDADAARAYVKEQGAPIVIKADGLAAGKGVTVAQTEDEALAAIHDIMEDQEFGQAGSRVVIEEFMQGEEASLLAFTDGKTIRPMIPSQDHKCVYDGDKGPNTGGMGAYAPAPVMTDALIARAEKEVLQPIVAAMAKEGRPYKGCLYAGLMITDEGPKVVEFNARFGDPETQVVLPLLDSDLVDIMLACVDGTLDDQDIQWSKDTAVCVVMTSGGYPKSYQKGYPITGIEAAEKAGSLVVHAGTAEKHGQIVTNGGRVLGVVAKGADIRAAVDQAYQGVAKISFQDEFHRKDIAHRALERMQK